MIMCGQKVKDVYMTHTCEGIPGHAGDHHCGGTCTHTWKNDTAVDAIYCKEQAKELKGCSCNLNKDHETDHKCACGLKWGIAETVASYMSSSIGTVLFAMVSLMDSNLSADQVSDIVNDEIKKRCTDTKYPSIENATEIIRAIGDRLGWEFDVPATQPTFLSVDNNF